MTIFLTGSSGFVGKNICSYFESSHDIVFFKRQERIIVSQDIVIHLAGKAHDLKGKFDPREYYEVNTELTKRVYDAFLNSDANIFIFLSSVKAVADNIDGKLFEDHQPNPISVYGKSKLLAEEYILSLPIPQGKRVYILRPSMIHGPGNKGNLNLLYSYCKLFSFWPLGTFDNKRSFCSISNLCFVINEMIQRKDIPSGVYNVADDEPISTSFIIQQMADKFNKKIHLLNFPKPFFSVVLRLASILGMHSLQVKFQKLTENFIVSNLKVKSALAKEFPVSAKEGLKKTIESFN
jgi:nucleoside-diphosphate-sugar epimerase